MFDSCQSENAGPKCSEVAEKLVQLFGWRQTYKVEKLQRNIPFRGTTKISLLRPTVEKITYKGPDSWVVVHNLQSQGGGILDPDDRLSDVADDREQILASFEDGDGGHHHGGGDGASGSSSIGTGSPDIFHDGEHKYVPSYSRTDIEVTGEQIASGITGVLHVRRGSEPALNQLPVGPPTPSEHTKRWSAAPLILEPPSMSYSNPEWNEEAKEEDEDRNFHRVARDGSNRLSMQFLGDGAGYRWAEAAERAASSRLHASTSLPREGKRREPLGQANSTSPTSTLDSDYVAELIVIRNEPGPLGIHVVPDYDRLGKDKGLLVQGIEPDGRIDRDGRLAIYDRIIEINGQSVLNMPFQRVQELFKLSLTSTELRLKVIKNRLDGLRRPPPPVYPRFPDDKENVSMVECEQKQSTNTKVATVSPTKKVPAVSRNLKSLLTANTRRIGRKIEIELVKGPHGLGFSITTRDNPAGGNCPIYIKNIIPKGAAVEDGRLKIGDRLLEVNGIEMTGKTQAEAVTILRNAPPGSKVRIVVSRQEDVTDNFLPRVVDVDSEKDELESERLHNPDVPPNIPPLPQSHLQQRTPDKGNSVARIISQFQEASNTQDKSDDNLIFPWKHKEIVTFDIPVHDSEKAGLGISVKGKTSGAQDLGIFIKSVINGGAASRDKRLRTNDQLLNVNGISLLHQSNSDAMETLRKAMLHTEGPVPGSITLTIARKAVSPGPTRDASRRNSASGLLNSSSGGDLYHSLEMDPSLTQDNSGASGGSTNTVIYKPSILENSKPSTNDSFSNMNTWNPVLDRLTGHNKQLRNESYYMATHDTWSASMMGNQSMAKLSSPTVNINSGEMILIEDECGPRVLPRQNSQSKLLNECYQNGNQLEIRSDHEPDGKAALSAVNVDKSTESSQNATCVNNDVTYASQLSLENPNTGGAFSRDAFGRQSMSEKRHATLDAKSTDTYQRSKKLREERDKIRGKETNLVRVGSVESVISVNRSSEHPEYADKLGELGPSLGMKKSSSLESLQTMVQEIQMQEEGDPAYSYRGGSGALKVIRGRGCDESFRAAVDKDYNKHLDPNHRSETNAKKHWLLDPPSDFERDPDGFTNVRGGPRQSSLNAALDVKNKNSKKKPGLLKGIGSMFRFGKHRKMDFVTPEPAQIYQNAAEFDADPTHQQQQQLQPDNGNTVTQLQKSPDGDVSEKKQDREQLYQKHGFLHRHAEQVQVIPEGAIPPMRYRNNNVHMDSNQNRGERSQLMRAYEHRQAQRQAHYAAIERDNEADQRIRLQNEQNINYGEYGRPGSRSGISEPVRFTHYVNYNELQNHLSGRKEALSDSQIVQMRLQVQQQRLKVEEESRKQHQYHSQRQVRNDNQLRPVSNFYEYESVQSILNTHGRPANMYPQQPPPYQDPVASSSSRQVQNRPHGVNSRNHITQYQQIRGPFITHVTIGDHQPQQAGSRV
ncbi:hypothetical protein RI129_006659 [Pyrocoelia pectoralis]|uniref:PDZ domain-containing protein n=1 Tax=Pyrocoelia pectoralis TaxID=417401 RepID=A0AAN7VK34_9COLE